MWRNLVEISRLALEMTTECLKIQFVLIKGGFSKPTKNRHTQISQGTKNRLLRLSVLLNSPIVSYYYHSSQGFLGIF